MARKLANTHSPKKYPLPLKGWLILIGVLAIIVGSVWYFRSLDIYEWRYVPKAGIRLPMKYTIHGIDVSKHNGRIDWPTLRQMRFEGLRFQFAYIKATEGTSLTDRDFQSNWRQADAVGLYRGAYHFFIPWKPPQPQFENFKRSVTLKKGDLPPVLDFEIGTNAYTQAQVIENLRTWLQLAESHYGIRPIIYTNVNFYHRYIKNNLDEYPLWVADYSDWGLRRFGNAHILFWQYSEKGSADGIRGAVDYNVFLGDAEALKALCKK
ncbi:MAG: glycoside hydrolase family 25 protein [Runella sp.]